MVTILLLQSASVAKPATVDENGPQGFTKKLSGVGGSICAYTDENIMAATWNVELMEEVGQHIGEDTMAAGGSGLYGPAMNTHRSPYAGRDFEYYSEDGLPCRKDRCCGSNRYPEQGCICLYQALCIE